MNGHLLSTAELEQRQKLSDRRFEVLTSVASGLSNCEIAHRMSLSEKTVKNHMSAIIAFYGTASRTGAVVKATQAGHIDLSTITVR